MTGRMPSGIISVKVAGRGLEVLNSEWSNEVIDVIEKLFFLEFYKTLCFIGNNYNLIYVNFFDLINFLTLNIIL